MIISFSCGWIISQRSPHYPKVFYIAEKSKDRSKRFMVGDLPFDSSHTDEHKVYLNQYWTIYPTDSVIRSAKVFLLGLIVNL